MSIDAVGAVESMDNIVVVEDIVVVVVVEVVVVVVENIVVEDITVVVLEDAASDVGRATHSKAWISDCLQ